MAKERSGTHGHAPTHPSLDIEMSEGPGNAGAHGAPEGEAENTSSGRSGDKGVHSVGRPDLPTGTGPGLRIGESEWGHPREGSRTGGAKPPDTEKDEDSKR